MNQTPLYQRHDSAGAKWGEFGGFAMPLWYEAGLIREHRAVLLAAGLFDTSHMSMFTISGASARELLQATLTRDLETALPGKKPLCPGRAAYGFFLDERGHVIDDVIVFQEVPDRYFVVVNAAMDGPVIAHLQAHAAADVSFEILTGTLAKLDLQGPKAGDILERVIGDQARPFPAFSFRGHYGASSTVKTRSGAPVLVSRSGYTGEFGFELYLPAEHATAVWDEILAQGQDCGILPCGLGARDSLRAGAMLPLSHQDIGDWPCIRHPWEFALPRADGGWSKSFIGDRALEQASDASYTYAFVGENNRKVPVGRDTRVLLADQDIGHVLTCVTDISIERVAGTILRIGTESAPADFAPRGLACGFVYLDQNVEPGTSLLLVNGRRRIQVTIATTVRPGRTFRMRW